MKELRLPFLIVFVLSIIGCASLENTAERPSPYVGDAALYNADLTIVTSKDLLNTFVKWERDNRRLINNLDVKHAADKVRASSKEAFASAIRLRDSYKLSPTSANKDALNAALDVITQALAESLGYMTKYTTQRKV